MGMSGDRSSRRTEVVAETRRRWSQAEKTAIVVEASAPCTNVSAVARRHGIKPALLFRWKKESAAARAPSATASFIPVILPTPSGPPRDAPSPRPMRDASAPPPLQLAPPQLAQTARPAAATDGATIEIELSNGLRVRVSAGVDAITLKRLITLLEG